jgi:hypothetical protein
MPIEYRKPEGAYIGRSQEKLYALEDKRAQAIMAAGRELGRLLGFSPEAFWTHTMPEELLTVLESFDRHAAKLAAEVFLEKQKAIDEQLERKK